MIFLRKFDSIFLAIINRLILTMQPFNYLISIYLFVVSTPLFAQQESNATAKVYFIHSNKFDGFSTPFDVSVDEKQVCKLHNKHYSIHEIAPGPHTFKANYSLMHVKNGIQGISFSTEPGKTYYVQAIYQKGFFSAKIICSEITENTAKTLLPMLKLDDCK
ncbi:DUF2846 domain-containing protein [Spirosoma sp. HMF3257]|uniref:DUF2846 domain-containing protein n=2 Tax=Spirosoma telluris TaxID=2183553 RepID=A0A327NS81_9BACT|nr:DUF2846 domain-containing protein [Spirosoma telluris]RAI75598.1 hypothetical protein HMF3257_18115 [Spirosoma telluris]